MLGVDLQQAYICPGQEHQDLYGMCDGMHVYTAWALACTLLTEQGIAASGDTITLVAKPLDVCLKSSKPGIESYFS